VASALRVANPIKKKTGKFVPARYSNDNVKEYVNRWWINYQIFYTTDYVAGCFHSI